MDRNEIRRLQKAARDNNKLALGEWAMRFEDSVKRELEKKYEEYYHQQLKDSIDIYMIALAYTAHFSETTELNKDKLPEFIEDFVSTIDMFRTGEYRPEEYKKILEDNGVNTEDIVYKSRKNKIIAFTGRKSLTRHEMKYANNNILLSCSYNTKDNRLQREKIDLCDILYVLANNMNDIDENMKRDIEYAKSKCKIIKYRYKERESEEKEDEHSNSIKM